MSTSKVITSSTAQKALVFNNNVEVGLTPQQTWLKLNGLLYSNETKCTCKVGFGDCNCKLISEPPIYPLSELKCTCDSNDDTYCLKLKKFLHNNDFFKCECFGDMYCDKCYDKHNYTCKSAARMLNEENAKKLPKLNYWIGNDGNKHYESGFHVMSEFEKENEHKKEQNWLKKNGISYVPIESEYEKFQKINKKRLASDVFEDYRVKSKAILDLFPIINMFTSMVPDYDPSSKKAIKDLEESLRVCQFKLLEEKINKLF